MNILAMTPEYARLLSLWKYEGIYSFYDHNEKNIKGYMDGTHYACTFVSFYTEASSKVSRQNKAVCSCRKNHFTALYYKIDIQLLRKVKITRRVT